MKELFLLLLTAFISSTAMAQKEIDGIYYNLHSDSTAEVKSVCDDYSEVITIPSTITENGIQYSVTSIGSDAFFGNDMSYINLPNSIVAIGSGAFLNCSRLISINIPNSVVQIGDNAFQACSSLSSVNIGKSVSKIGDYVFISCPDITSLTVSSENEIYDSRDNCNAIIESSTNILIAGCKNTIIPNNVTSIGFYAFNNCTDLLSITIPEGVTTIATGAFGNCGLTSITLPASVTSIEKLAFASCYGLTSVTVNNPTPVAINSNVFTNRKNATLHVPYGSREAYLNTAFWNEFKEIVEPDIRQEQSFTYEGIPSMFYGDTDYNLPEKTDEGLTIVWHSNNENIAKVTGNVLTIKGAGSTTITASQTGNDDYKPFSMEFSLSISKAPLTVTADNCEKYEGDDNPVFTFSYEGFVYDDDASCLTTMPTASTIASAASTPGTYYIYASGASSPNYDITYVNGILTVNPALPYVTLVLNSNYTTFTPVKDIDFTNVDGVEAYVITHYSRVDNTVTLERAYNIPAGTGLLIKGSPGSYRLPLTVANESYANLLKGNLKATAINHKSDGYVNLRLSDNNTFVPVTDNTVIEANKAYLKLLSSVYIGSTPIDIGNFNGIDGDMNKDGKVTVADVMKLVKMILSY